MRVTIYGQTGNWVLSIARNGQVIKLWTLETLYEAIQLASELQLHVDNINELALSQYSNQEAA